MRSTDELRGKNIVVYDLEIKNEIDGKLITWNDHDKMGISVGCLYDYESGDNMVFMDDNLAKLTERLNRADLIVAFNHLGFDNVLLRKSGQALKADNELPNYDMLLESRKGMGWRPGDRFPQGCKLDDHLIATFGKDKMKTAAGAEAPKMYQQGRMGELISYCLADVARERQLFERIWETLTVKTHAHGLHTLADPERAMRKPQ